MELYMFRTVSLSIIRSLELYTQQNLHKKYDQYRRLYLQCNAPGGLCDSTLEPRVALVWE